MRSGLRSPWVLLLVAACGGDGSGEAAGGGGSGSAGARGGGSGSAGAGGGDSGAVGTGSGGSGGAGALLSGGSSSAGGDGGTQAAAGARGATAGSGGTGGAGASGASPSCSGLAASCGSAADQDCCASSVVEGGTFLRSNDSNYPATVSAFRLDRYEITVGRFRRFVAAYSQGMPAAGAGKNPNDPSDPGWDPAWNAFLPVDAAALEEAVQCEPTHQAWTPSPGPNENRPMNCLGWYEAFAFCIWDGGRLPTEAEWNYAATGGSEQRVYPWSDVLPDDTYAVYCGGSCSTTQNVGAKSPKGDGKWGQADLAGNVAEWTLDAYVEPYAQTSCSDCASLPLVGMNPANRGGFFNSVAAGIVTTARNGGLDPASHYIVIGARCARSL